MDILYKNDCLENLEDLGLKQNLWLRGLMGYGKKCLETIEILNVK